MIPLRYGLVRSYLSWDGLEYGSATVLSRLGPVWKTCPLIIREERDKDLEPHNLYLFHLHLGLVHCNLFNHQYHFT